jgi:signal transduction histidine kinase
MSPPPDPFDSRSESDLREAKLRALAEFAAGAGHEINNPVATIVGHVQLLLAGETDPERRQALLTIGGQAYRIRDMIGDAMLFARPPNPQQREGDLVTALRETIQKFSAEAERAGVRIECRTPPTPVPIWADPVQLQIVIAALLKNSLEAVSRGGEIELQATESQGDVGEPLAILRLRDDGPGLPPPDREHLFDPFYSGRQAGRGLGFGLPKCWRIVTMHGGSISADSSGGQGLTFTVRWPAQPRSNQVETELPPESPTAS